MCSAAVTRAVMVGLALSLFMFFYPNVSLAAAHPWAVVWFGLMGSLFLAFIGILTSIWAEKFDHNAMITNFIVTPLTMLSGTFYDISNLAPVFRTASHLNPFFYVISGFRYGFIGSSDISGGDAAVLHSAIGLGLFNAALGLTTYLVLRSGWKLKS
jgi:ABC-2 type transport system permease protein